jgi:circadian clock protein KaiB
MTPASTNDHRPATPKRARNKPATSAPNPLTDCESVVVYHLRLYVAGFTSRSAMAVTNLKAICEEHLNGRYELDVVDIYQQPALARRAQIIAVPTLIRQLPQPLRRIVGDMSRKDRVLVGLDLLPRS